MDPILITLGISTLWSKCTGAEFAAGIIGNFLASLGYDNLVKPGVAAGMARLRELVTNGVTQENHNLLRAIWVSQNQALVLACEEVLAQNKRLRPGSLAIPQDLRDLNAWLSSETDAEVKLLLRLRAEALRAAQQPAKADLETIQRSIAANVGDAPDLLQAGSESVTNFSEQLIDLRVRVTENFLTQLRASLPYGPVLPAALERVIHEHWFDHLRLAFREVLKHDNEARHAFQFHIWEKIEGLPGKLDDMLARLDRLDQALDQMFSHMRWLVQAVETVYHQAQQQSQEALRAAIDNNQLVLDAQAQLASALTTLQQRVEFFHRDFEVRLVQQARRMSGEPLEVFLLRPEARAIPLTARRLEFRALWEWVHRDEAVNLCVMGVGPGAGKTRLAFELLLALQRQKNGDNSPQLPPRWRIGRVSIDSLRKFDHTKDWALWVWDRPTVIMVDYALEAIEALENWLRRVLDYARDRHAREEPMAPLRILLLEREASAKHLLERLRAVARGHECFFAGDAPMSLSVMDSLAERVEILERGVQCVAAEQNRPKPPLELDEEMRRLIMSEDFGQPLYLMMAAWEVVLRGDVHEALRLSRSGLVQAMAARERERIERYAGNAGQDRGNRQAMLRHFAAYATLCRGLSAQEAVGAAEQELKAARRSMSFDPPALTEVLGNALGEPDAPGAIAPVRPDIVGERFLYEWLHFYRADQERIEFITRGARQSSQAFQTLFRMTVDLPAEEVRNLSGWLHEAVTYWADLSPDLLELIDDALPRYHSGLVQLAANIALQRAVKAASALHEATGDVLLSGIACLLDRAGVRLHDADRNFEAVAVSKFAVEIYRRLHSRDPIGYGEDLASALDHYGSWLGVLDQRSDALTAHKEAMQILRQAYMQNPEAHAVDMAHLLNNLAIRLSESDYETDALEAIEEAVRILRKLYAQNPGTYAEDLAKSLGNLGIWFCKLKRGPDALTACTEAVKIYRDLYKKSPEAHGKDLAHSLINLIAVHLEVLGPNKDILAMCEDALDVLTELYARDPLAHGAGLARSLKSLGTCLWAMGEADVGLDLLEKALKVDRELYARDPEAYSYQLAMSLDNLGVKLTHSNRKSEALKATREAVQIYRALHERHEESYAQDLARSLHNLAIEVREFDSNEELEVVREGLKVITVSLLPKSSECAQLAAALALRYLKLSEELSQAPDEALLAPITTAILQLREVARSSVGSTNGVPEQDS